MLKPVFRVIVRVGGHQFHTNFENEKAALNCFNEISAAADDLAIEGDSLTLPARAAISDVTIQRSAVRVRLGDPSRQ
jgi:hypothetical protein